MSLKLKSIGEVSNELGVSAHTLRYYEKIGLMTNVNKNHSGRRQYGPKSISQIKFIKRAQKMQFSLEEIKQLLSLDQPTATMPKPEIRSMVQVKLHQIDENLSGLTLLKQDLTELLNSCQSSEEIDKCPILEGMKKHEK